MKFSEYNIKRLGMMLVGVLIMGFAVTIYNKTLFGTDPYTCMVLGMTKLFGFSFGVTQLILNCLIILLGVFFAKHFIGIGTLFNMVCIGFIADFCTFIYDKFSWSRDTHSQDHHVCSNCHFAFLCWLYLFYSGIGCWRLRYFRIFIAWKVKDQLSLVSYDNRCYLCYHWFFSRCCGGNWHLGNCLFYGSYHSVFYRSFFHSVFRKVITLKIMIGLQVTKQFS